MKRPKVAIVNSSSDIAACFSHLDDIVPVLKDELRRQGCLPFEVRTVAPSDFVTSAGRGGRYILPSRNLIVHDIEAVVEGAQLDAMICLSSCDKTTPAHVMAAVRLNIPTVIVACGYQRNALYEDGGSDIEEVFLKASYNVLGKSSETYLSEISNRAIRGPGVCAGLGTANSMHMAAEALGMAVPMSTPVRANSETMWDAVHRSATAVAEMIDNNLRPRDIITAEAIRNAVTVMLSIGASINTVKHLQAIAVEAEIDIDVWAEYADRGQITPILCAVRPNGPNLIEELEDAGGCATVMRELETLLVTDCVTVTGRTLSEVLTNARPADGKIIRTLDNPFSTDPSIVIITGSLAPEGAIVKLPVGEKRETRFSGPARIFSSRDEAIDALAKGLIKAGDVIVMRGMGLIGGPGMGFASALVFALDGSGIGERVAVVTDGQLSGLVNKGIVVGEVSPEAAAGGPIGLLEEGDLISIDLEARTANIQVDKEVLKARSPFVSTSVDGDSPMLRNFGATAGPLSFGAAECAGGLRPPILAEDK